MQKSSKICFDFSFIDGGIIPPLSRYTYRSLDFGETTNGQTTIRWAAVGRQRAQMLEIKLPKMRIHNSFNFKSDTFQNDSNQMSCRM